MVTWLILGGSRVRHWRASLKCQRSQLLFHSPDHLRVILWFLFRFFETGLRSVQHKASSGDVQYLRRSFTLLTAFVTTAWTLCRCRLEHTVALFALPAHPNLGPLPDTPGSRELLLHL